MQSEPTPEEVLSAGIIEVREVDGSSEAPAGFSIQWEDRSSFRYEDADGELRFWFDFNVPPGPVSLEIAPNVPLVHGSREEIAAQRVAKHLTGMGYKVSIYDSTLVDQQALEQATERFREALLRDGSLTMRPVTTPEPAPEETSRQTWSGKLLRWLRRPNGS
jgi:hypothetical protein